MALPDVFSNPLAYAGLIVVLVAVVAWQATITYSRAARINRIKRFVFPLADRFRRPLVRQARRVSPALGAFLNGVIPHLIHEKGRTSDAEYLETWKADLPAVFDRLSKTGFDPNVASSLKRRPAPVAGAYQYSALSMVYYHGDGTQTEVYVFVNGDGTVDIYAHAETSVTDPEGHLSDPQRDGDPRGVIPTAPDGAVIRG
jgi:hypothetical protein